MGNIQKNIVHGHLELSHPLESVSDKLICRGDQVKAIENERSAVLDVIILIMGR